MKFKIAAIYKKQTKNEEAFVGKFVGDVLFI